jgi:hypothetical protein
MNLTSHLATLIFQGKGSIVTWEYPSCKGINSAYSLYKHTENPDPSVSSGQRQSFKFSVYETLVLPWSPQKL